MSQPIDLILSKLKKVKKNTNGKWTALCPAHDDKKPSLSISVDNDGKVALHCFTGCQTKHILSSIDLQLSALFPNNQKNLIIQSNKKQNLTLALIAKDKHLPESFLNELGVVQIRNYLQITYFLEDGSKAIRQRKRTALKAKDGSFWNQKKGELVPYGLWKLSEAKQKGFLLLPEGESDCWTLWFHHFPALGIPGASMTNTLKPQYLDGVSKIYIINEGKQAGNTFTNGISKQLQTFQWPGKVFILTMPNGLEDVNDLHKSDSDTFKELFNLSLEQATTLKIPSSIEEKTVHRALTTEFQNLLISENEWHIPEGWSLDDQGVYRITISKNYEQNKQRIAHSPFIISARSINIDFGYEQLELSFLRDKLLRQIWAERGELLNHRSLIVHANQGFPVTSRNSAQLVDYISDFEATNLHQLPRRLTVSSFGWKRYDNNFFFVLGEQAIGTKMKINFVPEGDGERTFAKALKTKGSLEQWLNIVRKVVSFPKALFALYAGFTPPLLPLFEISSFSIDYCGNSSVGKTTTIMIPASIYGDPVGERGGIVPTWNATSVSIERYATLFNALPIFLDDSHLATDQQVKSVIYMLAGGVGRMRGSLKGNQSISAWHTVGFFTGERPVTSVTTHEGARARVIEFHGSPFPGISGELVSQIKSALNNNFGHAGPLFLQKLIQIINEERELLKTKTASYSNILKNLAPSGIDNRKASYFAAVWATASIVEELFQLGGKPAQLIPKLFEETCGEGRSFGQKAMEALSSWVMGNWNNFSDGKNTVSGEVYGVIQSGEYVAVFPHKLEEFFTKKGFSYEAAIRTFRDLGWIQTEGKHLTSRIRYQKTVTRMIKIFWNDLTF